MNQLHDSNITPGADEKIALSPVQPHKRDLEASLATLLTAGTALAAVVLFFGAAMYLRADHAQVLNFKTFNPSAHASVFSVFRDAIKLDGASVMQLGVVLLILTPVTRVLFTLLAFLYKRDWMYVVVTVIVLGVLCYGLFGSGLANEG
ncbi:MAG: DUF1634 domain-containing protein [Phycisphaerales bacterium]